MVKTLSFHHRGHGFDPWSIHAGWPHTKLNEMCVCVCMCKYICKSGAKRLDCYIKGNEKNEMKELVEVF